MRSRGYGVGIRWGMVRSWFKEIIVVPCRTHSVVQCSEEMKITIDCRGKFKTRKISSYRHGWVAEFVKSCSSTVTPMLYSSFPCCTGCKDLQKSQVVKCDHNTRYGETHTNLGLTNRNNDRHRSSLVIWAIQRVFLLPCNSIYHKVQKNLNVNVSKRENSGHAARIDTANRIWLLKVQTFCLARFGRKLGAWPLPPLTPDDHYSVNAPSPKTGMEGRSWIDFLNDDVTANNV